MRHFKQSLTAIFLLVTLNGCATKPLVFTGFDATQDFSELKTFTWIQTPPLLVDSDYPISALIETRMTAAIKAEFIMHGYEFVPNKERADFIVMYTLGSRKTINIIESSKDTYGKFFNWVWAGPYMRYFFNFPTDKQYKNYQKGTIAVDVFNAKSMAPIWHAQASKPLTKQDIEAQAKNAPNIAEKLLFDFPFKGCHVVITPQCQPFEKAL